MSKKNRVRPLAICIFHYHDCILVAESYDPVKNEQYFRPLGGGIEFGEKSTDTICRELREEIGVEVDIESLRYLGAVENIFNFNGKPGHEIILIYDGALKEQELYNQAVIFGREADGEEIKAVWKNIHEFGEGKAILYPAGLLEMLA